MISSSNKEYFRNNFIFYKLNNVSINFLNQEYMLKRQKKKNLTNQNPTEYKRRN